MFYLYFFPFSAAAAIPKFDFPNQQVVFSATPRGRLIQILTGEERQSELEIWRERQWELEIESEN